MLSKGLQPRVGSFEFRLMERQVFNERLSSFLQTQVIVSSIFAVGNAIISAVTKSPQSSTGNNVQKTLEALRDVLLPEQKEATDAKMVAVAEKLRQALEGGPLKVRSLAEKRQRQTLRARRGH
jgi:hypothetical protein